MCMLPLCLVNENSSFPVNNFINNLHKRLFYIMER